MLEMCKRLYAAQVKALGEEHEDPLSTKDSMAVAYKQLGNSETALTLLEEIYRAKRKYVKENSPRLLFVLRQKVFILAELGRYEEAALWQEKVYLISSQHFVEGAPQTLQAKALLEEYKRKSAAQE